MMLRIARFAIPATLLCFAATTLADPMTGTAAASAAGTTSPATVSMKAAGKGDLGQKVREKLMADKRLQNAKIETAVTEEGSILLRGTVDNAQQSRIAQQLASTVTGVSKVRNELQVPSGE